MSGRTSRRFSQCRRFFGEVGHREHGLLIFVDKVAVSDRAIIPMKVRLSLLWPSRSGHAAENSFLFIASDTRQSVHLCECPPAVWRKDNEAENDASDGSSAILK